MNEFEVWDKCEPGAAHWSPAVSPVRCVCGDRSVIAGHRIQCAKDSCWSGPWAPDLRAAVLMWNELMERAK